MDAFEAIGTDFGRGVVGMMAGASPTSLKVWHRHYSLSQGMPLKVVLTQEYGLTQQFVQHHDFFEGIRALLVVKDQAPQWRPKVLEGVHEKDVGSYFTTPPAISWKMVDARGIEPLTPTMSM